MKPQLTHIAPLLLTCLLASACGNERPQASLHPLPTPTPTVAPFQFNHNAPDLAHTGFIGNPNVQNFIQRQAQQGQDPIYLSQFFANAQYKPNIIDIMNRPGTSRPWYTFRQSNAGGSRIAHGQRFYRQHQAVLKQIAQQYGVPAEIIVAIIGIETHYGNNMGSFRLADSLPTLGFGYPRRAEFFQNELAQFLLMAQEERRDPYSFTGSYAGAMGLPQFMPSSYRKWAVDYDGDGQRNIWGSVPDAAASVANYFKAHGWQSSGRIMIPAQIHGLTPQLQALLDETTSLKRTIGELKQMGITPLAPAADHEQAVFFRLETAPNQFEYYLGFNNFYTIWQYNHSRLYVSAVREIALGLGAQGL